MKHNKIIQILKWLILILCWLFLSVVFVVLLSLLLFGVMVLIEMFIIYPYQMPSFLLGGDEKFIALPDWLFWLSVITSMTFAGYIIYRFAKKRNKNSKTISQ